MFCYTGSQGLLAKFSGYFWVSMVSMAQHAPRLASTCTAIAPNSIAVQVIDRFEGPGYFLISSRRRHLGFRFCVLFGHLEGMDADCGGHFRSHAGAAGFVPQTLQ